jgi:uncharacterized membrane protein
VDLWIIALRILHVGSAILWVGGSFFIERFFQPTADELGATGAPFVSAVLRRRMPTYFAIVAAVTVLAGTALYWIDAGGNVVAYFTDGHQGTIFGIGGIAAWVSFLIGGALIGPNSAKVAKATDAMATSGPTPELLAQAANAAAAIKRAGQVSIVGLTIAILTMATARYF